MKHEIIDMIYDHEGIRFNMLDLPDHIGQDAYIGLFDELYIRLFDDFFDFDNDEDSINVPFSMLCDMHHLIDVYQLAKDSFLDVIEQMNLEVIPFRVHLSFDDDYNLTIDFDHTIGAAEVFFAMIVFAGETLDASGVTEMILNINFDLISLHQNGVVS